ILRSTENFREEEVDVALELFDESFLGEEYVCVGAFWRETGSGKPETKAAGSAQHAAPLPDSRFPLPALVGFACYGPTMGTDRTYDLYWIAVDRSAQGSGCGTVLLTEVERRLEALHARMLVVETSSRSDYTATRGFYLGRGYAEAARVREFYAPEDDRIILTKRLEGSPREGLGAVA
ncbi:MAG TPA: GNAT family N-acetyltransferase, partial [Gemmatimonadaceae bacterium]|nr:GNAT family N-acetyltransferase [Gemmatimonadaceae bacterium]